MRLPIIPYSSESIKEVKVMLWFFANDIIFLKISWAPAWPLVSEGRYGVINRRFNIN
jgi:hypothetical protein